jgi:multidrug resistance efflux pump
MAINLAQHNRWFWKPYLVVFLCGLSIGGVNDRVMAQSTLSRKRIQQITVDRKALIAESKASLQILLQKMKRMEALWKAGAVSDAHYHQAQSDVANAQKQLNRLICDDLISPKISVLRVQLRSKLNQKKRYQALRDAG